MMKMYGKDLMTILLAFIISVGFTEFILPKAHTPYVRIMEAEMRRDYPLFQMVKDSSPGELQDMKSVYPVETLYALDIFMDNQMNLKKARAALPSYLKEIDELTLDDEANINLQLMGFKRDYVPEVRFISTGFLLVMVVIIYAIWNQVIYYLKKNKNRTS